MERKKVSKKNIPGTPRDQQVSSERTDWKRCWAILWTFSETFQSSVKSALSCRVEDKKHKNHETVEQTYILLIKGSLSLHIIITFVPINFPDIISIGLLARYF